ncbi:MAG: KfrB domain-containing protein [Pseudomonadota bacterium]
MIMKTVFSRTLGPLGGKIVPAASTPLSSTGANSASPFGLTQSSVRAFHDVPTLKFHGPLLMLPTTAAGQAALEKVSLRDSVLRGSRDGWEQSVADLNVSAFKAPTSLTGQFGLTYTETVGLSLAVLQAGTKLGVYLDTPAVASLMFNLLSPLPVETQLTGEFEKFAHALGERVLPDTPILSAAGNWHERPGAERLEAVKTMFSHVYKLARETGIAPDSSHTVRLQWDEGTSPFSAFFAVLPRIGVASGNEGGHGHVNLSRQLIDADSRAFAEHFGDAEGLRDLAAAMIMPLLSHEIFHASQHASLEILNGNKQASEAQWTQAVQRAISIGTQSVIYTEGLAIYSGESAVLPQLLHEKEAWALTFGVMKTMINSPAVPDRYKSPMVDLIANNFDKFSPFHGVGPALKPMLPSGELWDSGHKLCVRTSVFEEAFKREKVMEYLSSPARVIAPEKEKQRLVVMAGQRIIQSEQSGRWHDDKAEDAGNMKPGIYNLHAAMPADKYKNHDGMIVHADQDAVYQKTGQGLVRHAIGDFDKVPVIGDMKKISYDKGRVVVGSSSVTLGRGIS